jgi:50S ribosomal protein L16 3-hydroxylase
VKSTLGNMPVSEFLTSYWQQSPCVIRGIPLPQENLLDANDLAGLSCEPLAEARIIGGPDEAGQWTLAHGPFEEKAFDSLGDRDWTLLVQDVEKHYPPMGELLRQFAFLPSWRLDDLMVSFAATGGSVGAHVDQYDVFLLQLQGTRRWEIACEFDPQLRPDSPLNMLQSFAAEESWDLAPGDMLYLPPGVAHHGVALEPCLTASIGFRAPSKADLFLALGEWFGERDDQGGRYRDPVGISGQPTPVAGELDERAMVEFGNLLTPGNQQSEDLREFLGAFLSRFRLAHEPVAPTKPLSLAKIHEHVSAGALFYQHPWSRYNWFHQGGEAVLYAAGHRETCSVKLAIALCADDLTPELFMTLEANDKTAICALLNAGQLLLD